MRRYIVGKKKYLTGDVYMIRTPIIESSEYINLCSSLQYGDVKYEDYFIDILKNNIVREAIAIASLDLFESINNIDQNHNDMSKIIDSVLKYYSRMITRPTPYGIFAGICCGEFSDRTKVILSDRNGHKKRARADMNWIYGIIELLEEDEEILWNLKVKFNDQCYEHGNRLKNPYVSNYGQVYNNRNSNKVDKLSIRYTNQVKFVKENCKDFIYLHELANVILKNNESVDFRKIKNFLRQLIQNEYLITELRPPIGISDPLKHLTQVLFYIDKQHVLYKKLYKISQMIEVYNLREIGEGLSLYLDICNQMKNIFKSKNYLQVDTVLKNTINIIGNNVKEELEYLAEGLMGLATVVNEPSYLKRFREKFIEKYGVNMEVSILELIDSDIGLGYPSEYGLSNDYISLNNEGVTSLREFRYNEVINNKILLAIKNGVNEVEITKEDLNYINEGSSLDDFKFAKSFEINIIISSKSNKSIDDGDFRIYIGPNYGSQKAGNSFNRFYDIIHSKYSEKLDSLYSHEKNNSIDEYIIASIHEVPRNGRLSNIGIGKNNHDYHIVLSSNTNIPERKINISDIYIGIEQMEDRFYIKSKSLNKKLKVISDNMLNLTGNSKLIRFLREISYSYEVHLIERLMNIVPNKYKYLPRIVFGKTILQNATWIISKKDFNGLNNEIDFNNELIEFRRIWDIPRYVYHSQNDNRLLLDLERKIHIKYLYRVIKKSATDVVLTEIEGRLEDLWVVDQNNNKFFSEIVVPFLLETNINNKVDIKKDLLETSSDISKNINLIGLLDNKRLILPGDDNWIYFKLYGNNQRIDELIGLNINTYMEELSKKNLIEKYFFIRYADPENHVRLRIKGYKNSNILELLPQLNVWFNRLKEEGLISRIIIDTYDREIERYGGIDLISPAEDFFHTDSKFVSKIMQLKESKLLSLDDDSLGIIGVISIVNSFIGDLELEEKYMSSIVEKNEYRKEFKEYRNKYMEMVDLGINWEKLKSLTEGEILKDLLIERKNSIIEYVKFINIIDNKGELSNTKSNILASMVHMFCNRFKADRIWERKIWALTRHSLYATNSKKRKKVM